MLIFTDYIPSEEDIDKVKLNIVKLLFNNGFNVDSVDMLNEKDGTKQIKIVLKPKVNNDEREF